MSYRCQTVYLPLRQCPMKVVEDEEICRWHRAMKLLRETTGNMPRPRWMIAAGLYGFVTSIAVVRMFIERGPHPIVLLGAIWGLTAAASFFCQGMILLDYTLSHLPWLARIFAWSTAICVATGFTIAVIISALGSELTPALVAMTSARSPWMMRNAHLVVGPMFALLSLFLASVFVRTVLVRSIPYLSHAAMFFIAVSTMPLVETLAVRAGVPNARSQSQWETALGPNAEWITGGTFFGTFLICTIVNFGIRHAECTEAEFRATASSSFTACMFPPGAVMVAALWIFQRTGYSSPVVFIAATLVLSIWLCRWSTRRIIRAVQAS